MGSLRKQNMDTSAMDDEEDDDDEVEHFTYDEEQVGDSVLSSVGLLGGENPEGEANSGSCQGGPFSALTRSMWPSKGRYEIFKFCMNENSSILELWKLKFNAHGIVMDEVLFLMCFILTMECFVLSIFLVGKAR